MLRFAVTLILAVGVAGASRGGPWPDLVTDLPPDPALQTGALPNGVRYAILRNAEPRDRVSLRLVVLAGAQNETEDERGLAHFVEHMAFRGTRTHPAGTAIAALQRLGVGFGPDNTAFTYFDRTIYQLELPNTDESVLHESLGVLREYADEISFDAPLIEKERGVVLNELATRDTAAIRAGRANLAFLFPGSLSDRRPVGGIGATIARFTREQFTAFYDAWYRPDRLAVVVVGDLDPAIAAHQIAAQFGGLAPRAAARPEPAGLQPDHARSSDVQVYTEPGILGVQFTIEHPVARPQQPSTHELRTQRLHESLALGMLQRRLQKLAHGEQETFVTPQAQVSGFIPGWSVVSISAASKIDDWGRVASELEREHRRAFQFGFTAAELDEMRSNTAAALEEGVRMAATRRSEMLAQQIVECLVGGTPFATPAAWRQDMAEELARTTPEDCLQAFRQAWSRQAPHVYLAAHPSFQITRDQIAVALNQSRAMTVDREPEVARAPFAYTDFGPPGRLAHHEHLEDLDAWLARFENGLRLNFKSTRFEADLVEIRVRIGTGKLSQPKNQPGLDLLANAIVTAGGLGRHTLEELGSVLAGHFAGVSFSVGTNASVFYAHCPSRDLPVALQLIAAYLTDAAYRPEALREAHASLNTMFASLAASPSGAITMNALREIAGGDPRFGIAQPVELNARTVEEVKSWLDPQFKQGPIEMSIVGDVSWEDASAAVARTLGALRKRREPVPPDDAGTPQPVRALVTPRVYTMEPKNPLAAVAWYCPVPPLNDIHEDRLCHLLAGILADRVRVRVRDGLGAAYNIGASFVETDGFPALNHFVIFAEVAPKQVSQALALLEREPIALALAGLPPDEFERGKAPYLHLMSDDVSTNAYWGATVLADAQSRPARLAAARNRARDVAAISGDEINAIAKRLFDRPNAFKFAVVPPSAPGTAAAATLFNASMNTALLAPPLDASAADRQPVVLYQAVPAYPPKLLKSRRRGEVVVEFIVEADGGVQDLKAVSQTSPEFVPAALESLKRWKFLPGVKAGQPVRTRMRVPIIFEPAAPR